MSGTDLAAVITATTTAVTAAIVAASKAWRASVQRAVLEAQSRATIDAKNREIEKLTEENGKMWKLLEGLTS